MRKSTFVIATMYILFTLLVPSAALADNVGVSDINSAEYHKIENPESEEEIFENIKVGIEVVQSVVTPFLGFFSGFVLLTIFLVLIRNFIALAATSSPVKRSEAVRNIFVAFVILAILGAFSFFFSFAFAIFETGSVGAGEGGPKPDIVNGLQEK